MSDWQLNSIIANAWLMFALSQHGWRSYVAYGFALMVVVVRVLYNLKESQAQAAQKEWNRVNTSKDNS